MKYEEVVKKLTGKFGKDIKGDSRFRGELTVVVDAAAVDCIADFANRSQALQPGDNDESEE